MMKFTGERFVPSEKGRIRLEHYHRYKILEDLIKGKEVLDVACGEGYGSSLMAGVANIVVGVDISAESVEHARSSYQKNNVSFQQGSVINLEFENDSFDVVVSFETVEHLLEQKEMMAEIKRVMRPNGLFIVSSPNRPVFHEEYGSENEFHLKELDYDEFNDLLRLEFKYVDYYGQRMTMGSMIKGLGSSSLSYRVWYDDGEKICDGMGRSETDPVYYLAVCANQENVIPKIESSVLLPDDVDLVKYYLSLAKWAQNIDKEMKNLKEHDLEKVKSLEKEVEILRGQMSMMIKSLSWRITRPLRMLKSIFK